MNRLPVIVPKDGDSRPRKKMTVPTPNTYIPEEVWRAIQINGSMGVERLTRILGSQQFHKLPMKDQLKAIAMAHDQAYRPATPTALALTLNPNSTPNELNALKLLASQALDLPEFRKKTTTG